MGRVSILGPVHLGEEVLIGPNALNNTALNGANTKALPIKSND